MNFKQKLQKLYKLQLSINSLTEEVFQKQLSSVTHQMPSRSKPSQSSQLSPKSSKLSEVSRIILLLQKQNTELTSAIQKNLNTLSGLISPLIEKTLSLLVIVQQHLPNTLNNEFLSERAEIEIQFKEVTSFIRLFTGLFVEDDDTNSDFERYSTISQHNLSPIRIETDEIDLRRELGRIQETGAKGSENFSDETLQTEQFLKILEQEIQSDRDNLTSLSKLFEKVEVEKRNLCEGKAWKRDDNKILLVSKVIDELITILKSCLRRKQSKVNDLKSVRGEFNRSLNLHSRKNPSFEDLDQKFAYSYNGFQASGNNSAELEKFGFPLPPKFNQLDDLDDSSSISSRSIHLKPPRDDSKKELQRLRAVNENFKKNDEKHQEIVKNLKSKLKNLAFNATGSKAIQEMREEVRDFKYYCVQELNSYENDLKAKIFIFSKEFIAKISQFSRKFKEEIEELNENNEILNIQIEALKDEFQDEVKKINGESSELRRTCKEYKDKLDRSTIVMARIGKEVGAKSDNLENVWNGVDRLAKLIKEIAKEVGVRNIEKVEELIQGYKERGELIL